jgi:hypothetical protein
MATIAFTPVIGSVGYLDGTALDYTTPGYAYCTELEEDGRETKITPNYAPGEYGASTKNEAGGQKEFSLELVYICSSEDLCRSQFKSDTDNLSAGVFAMGIGLDDTIYNGCVMKKAKSKQPKSTGFGTYQMKSSMTIICYRP